MAKVSEQANGTVGATPAPAAESVVATEPRRPHIPTGRSQVVEMPDTEPVVDEQLKKIYEDNGLDFATGLPKPKEAAEDTDESEDSDETEDLLEVEGQEESDDESADDDEEDSGEEPPQEPQTVEHWAELIRDNPGRINEIPAKMRGDAIKYAFDTRLAAERDSYSQDREQTLAQARQQWEAESKTRQAVAEIDELLENDGESFAEWAKQYPDRAATYYDFKRREKTGELPGAPSPTAVLTQERLAAGAQIVSRLDPYPELKARLLERNQKEPARYDARTAESIANVAQDVAELLAEAETAKRTKESAPKREASEARQKAAAELKGVPKPSLKGGSSSSGPLTLEKLKAMTTEENMELLSTPEGQKEIDRVLATAAKR